jgi:hypothetical protein
LAAMTKSKDFEGKESPSKILACFAGKLFRIDKNWGQRKQKGELQNILYSHFG